jgi:hypothetical protein
LPPAAAGPRIQVVSAEQRRLLAAGLERTGGRLDQIEQRLAALDRLAGEIDGFERRLARLEAWLGPKSFGAHALRRQRTEAIAAARARGMSANAIAKAFALSPRNVQEVVARLPDPDRIVGLDGRTYRPGPRRAASAASGNGAAPRGGVGDGRTVKIEGVTTGGEHIAVYGTLSTFSGHPAA